MFSGQHGGEASTQHSPVSTYCSYTFHGWQNNIDVAVKKMAMKLSKIAISENYTSVRHHAVKAKVNFHNGTEAFL